MKALVDIAELEELDLNNFLTFKLDDEVLSIPVKRVVEIQEITNITKIPNASPYMAGVLNLRGKILPVIDMKVKFGLNPIVPTEDTCIVVIETELEGETTMVGTLVDAVIEVVGVPDHDIVDHPGRHAKFDLEYIAGVFKKDDKFIMLINIDKVCELEENHARI